MGDKHEAALLAHLGGRQTKGSGNQWQNPADGRLSRYEVAYAFAWDGKSTFNKSLSISLDMIAKIREQASPESPLIGIRFYDANKGTKALEVIEDWVALPLDDFAEMLYRLNDLCE